jgi:glycosyltransferase involved in cell wall biosynthesis
MQAVSLVIVAQDEERTIGRVIEAARPLVQEIIVIDSGSTDKTVEIAESNGARVQHQDWLGFARQKNFAIEQAKYDWVLSLDADEILTDALVVELKQLLASADLNNYDGYKIPRILFIGERAITHGGFYPDAQLRLFKRNAGKFGDRLVHEAIKMDGPVKVLNNCMNHYAYRSVDDFAAAMDKYARLSAQEFFNRGKYGWRASQVNEFLNGAYTFLYRYFVRGGILDGDYGLRLALIYCGYVRKKSAYLRELIKQNKAALNQ